MKKISIIVPIYNVEKYLRECLDSLVHQDMPLLDYEVILVNDGSRDRSGVIAKEYASLYENVSYYEQENQGQAVARNLGMDKAQGEYVMFVDSDDYLLENVLNGIYAAAKKEDADICVGKEKVMRKDGTFTIDSDIKKVTANSIMGRDALLNGMVLGSVCARVFRKEFLLSNNVQFVPDMKHEDVYFNLSLLPYADRVFFVENPIYYYRWNGKSTDRSNAEESVFRGLTGDLEVALLAMNLAKIFINDKALSSYLQKLSSSLMVGNVYSLWNENKKLSVYNKKRYINLAKQRSLLPIQTKGLGWKSFVLATIINVIYGR